MRCELRHFEALGFFHKGLCYSFPTIHCNNQNMVERKDKKIWLLTMISLQRLTLTFRSKFPKAFKCRSSILLFIQNILRPSCKDTRERENVLADSKLSFSFLVCGDERGLWPNSVVICKKVGCVDTVG